MRSPEDRLCCSDANVVRPFKFDIKKGKKNLEFSEKRGAGTLPYHEQGPSQKKLAGV